MGRSLLLTVRLFEPRYHGTPDWPPATKAWKTRPGDGRTSGVP